MKLVVILIEQILMMFFMMGIGFILRRKSFFKDEHLQGLSNMLLNLIMPFTLISAFIREFNLSYGFNLLITLGLSFVASLLAIIIPKAVFKKECSVEVMSVAFSNVSFMGIPLVSALLGSEYVFYIAGYIAIFNVFIWTAGVYIVTGDVSKITLKKVIFNPNIIAIIVGIIIFISPVKAPNFINKAVYSLGSMSTPISMILIGSFLADSDLIKILKTFNAWMVVAIRLFMVPIVTMAILYFIPSQFNDLKLLVLIAAATPSASSAAVMSRVYNKDFVYASGIVSLTTIVSFISMPLIIYLGQFLFKMI